MDWLYVLRRGALAAAVARALESHKTLGLFLREAEGDARRLEHIKRPNRHGDRQAGPRRRGGREGRTKVAAELLIKAEKDFDAAGMAALLAVRGAGVRSSVARRNCTMIRSPR